MHVYMEYVFVFCFTSTNIDKYNVYYCLFRHYESCKCVCIVNVFCLILLHTVGLTFTINTNICLS